MGPTIYHLEEAALSLPGLKGVASVAVAAAVMNVSVAAVRATAADAFP